MISWNDVKRKEWETTEWYEDDDGVDQERTVYLQANAVIQCVNEKWNSRLNYQFGFLNDNDNDIFMNEDYNGESLDYTPRTITVF